jgi:hypothetical protein
MTTSTEGPIDDLHLRPQQRSSSSTRPLCWTRRIHSHLAADRNRWSPRASLLPTSSRCINLTTTGTHPIAPVTGIVAVRIARVVVFHVRGELVPRLGVMASGGFVCRSSQVSQLFWGGGNSVGCSFVGFLVVDRPVSIALTYLLLYYCAAVINCHGQSRGGASAVTALERCGRTGSDRQETGRTFGSAPPSVVCAGPRVERTSVEH